MHNARIMDEKHPQIVYTSEITQAIKKKEAEFNINYLQNKIEKSCDVRATFVGEKCFAVAIDSQLLEDTCIDWRRGEHILQHTPIELPHDIQAKCLRLMQRLNLDYGAFDFVLDKQGNYVLHWFSRDDLEIITLAERPNYNQKRNKKKISGTNS